MWVVSYSTILWLDSVQCKVCVTDQTQFDSTVGTPRCLL